MKIVCLLCLVLGAMNTHASEILKVLECHDKVVQHGIEALGFAGEVNALFGATNVDHFISNFGSKTRAPLWNAETYFAGRYGLTLQIPISIDYENCKVNGATGEAFIQINETIEVEISTSGIAGATQRGQWRLNEKEWKRLMNNKGDWSAVGVPILTNAPVKGFDEYVRQGREPIRNRKEGFDNRIKQTLQTLRDRKPKLVEANKEKAATNGLVDALPSELGCNHKVVRQGVDTLVFPKEVESLFGASNVDHFISNFGSKTHAPVWNSATYFAGRYQLSLQVPIAIDYDKCRMLGAINSAMVQIDEMIRVKISKSGFAEATMRGQWTLNENEWKWLVKNSGDWAVVKLPILTNAPVKGFEEYVRQRREALRNRQGTFDKP